MSEAVGILGLALRSRSLCSGEIIFKKISSKDASLLILADDIGENSKKKYLDKCSFYHVPYVFMDHEDLSKALGGRNRKAVLILNKGFGEKLSTCLKG